MSRAEYLAAWSVWHGGTDPADSRLVRGWLSLAYTVATGLRALSPNVVTVGGLLVAASAVAPSLAGGSWLLLAGALVGLSGLLDSLDGALAILSGRASRRGFVLDSAVDRLTEAGYATALWLAGAPGPLAAAFGALCWLPDYLRARAGQAGLTETGSISVWERPTRVTMAGCTLGGAGVVGGPLVVLVGTAVGIALGALGTAQLGLDLRRRLGAGATYP